MPLHFFVFNEFYLVYSKFYLCFSINCSLVLIAFPHSLMHILIIFGILFCRCSWRQSCSCRDEFSQPVKI